MNRRFTAEDYATEYGCSYSTAKYRLSRLLLAGWARRFTVRKPYQHYDHRRKMWIRGINLIYEWEFVNAALNTRELHNNPRWWYRFPSSRRTVQIPDHASP